MVDVVPSAKRLLEDLSETCTFGKIYYREVHYKYRLERGYAMLTPICPSRHAGANGMMALTTDGVLCFRAGYAWDGPSGPTWDTRSAMRASLVHDGLYQLMREGSLDHTYRKAADDLFFEILKADGMPAWRRFLWWRAVRRFAAGAIVPRDPARVTRTAP